MRIYNAEVYVGSRFVRGGIDFEEKIKEIGEGVTGGDIDADGAYILPGLIDIHTHGAAGADVSDGNPEGLVRLSEYYASEGITSWCPTTMTVSADEMIRAVRNVRGHAHDGGAKVAGINLEGPFISKEKRGAQNAKNVIPPDFELFNRINAESGGLVRLITVAPEQDGALAFIEKASRICAVSVGHTAADYDSALAAFKAGASHVTHLFNAMPPMLHRNPSVIGAAFDSGATVELIADLIHVHPAAIRLTFAAFGDRVALVSDSLRCAGMPDGIYELGGQSVTVSGGRATLTGSDTIAGSSISLLDALRNCVSIGIPLERAVYAATAAPARAINARDTGSLEAGKCADVIILDRDLSLKAVYIDGRRFHG